MAESTTSASPAAEVISPAEARFWAEWADKAPGLLRDQTAKLLPAGPSGRNGGQLFSMGLGVALGIATLTRAVPGKWKILSGAAAGAALGAVPLLGDPPDPAARLRDSLAIYADALERDQGLRARLADYLSSHVTANGIQAHGVGTAVTLQALSFGREATPYLAGVARAVGAAASPGR